MEVAFRDPKVIVYWFVANFKIRKQKENDKMLERVTKELNALAKRLGI